MKNGNQYTRSIQLSSTLHFNSLSDYKIAGEGNPIAHGQTALHVDNGYGLQGNPTLHVLQDSISKLEKGQHTLLFSSGLTALIGLGALLNKGDHWLIPDSVYAPLRRFADSLQQKYDIAYDLYDTNDLDTLTRALKPETKLIHIESPSSITFDITDIDEVVRIAKARNIITSADNTWASGVLYQPLEHGVDISILSLTKYIAGYSDVFMGSVTTKKEALHKQLALYHRVHGHTVSPVSAMLVSRGLESLRVRLAGEAANAAQLVKFLQSHPKVLLVYALQPDLPKGIAGPNSLFSIALQRAYDDRELEEAFSRFTTFAIGESWGGTRSLVLPFQQGDFRGRFNPPQHTVIRFHAGLEDTELQLADLEAFLEALD